MFFFLENWGVLVSIVECEEKNLKKDCLASEKIILHNSSNFWTLC